MIEVKNMPRRSYQIDSDFAYLIGLEPWPRFYALQDKLLKELPEQRRKLLLNWIDGKPVKECL